MKTKTPTRRPRKTAPRTNLTPKLKPLRPYTLADLTPTQTNLLFWARYENPLDLGAPQFTLGNVTYVGKTTSKKFLREAAVLASYGFLEPNPTCSTQYRRTEKGFKFLLQALKGAGV